MAVNSQIPGNARTTGYDEQNEARRQAGLTRSGPSRPGNSHTDSPDCVVRVADQVEWALSHIRDNAPELLDVAEYGYAAKLLDTAMVSTALDGIRSHLERNSGLRNQAIADKLIDA